MGSQRFQLLSLPFTLCLPSLSPPIWVAYSPASAPRHTYQTHKCSFNTVTESLPSPSSYRGFPLGPHRLQKSLPSTPVISSSASTFLAPKLLLLSELDLFTQGWSWRSQTPEGELPKKWSSVCCRNVASIGLTDVIFILGRGL